MTPHSDLAQPWLSIPPTGPMLRPRAAAKYLGYSATQFYALAARGELPSPIKIGRGMNGASGVPVPWLDAMIASRFAESVGA